MKIEEIQTFNGLFAEAKLHGFQLNSFHQTPNGAFRCNWRRESWFGAVAEHERPFDAALNALVMADLTAPTRKSEPTAPEDLFG